ncbi:MAG: integrase [Oscillospiraceae bacterium]|jgi:hypothetical protein|nr:integrase [Oscillospiraceae bacterium]
MLKKGGVYNTDGQLFRLIDFNTISAVVIEINTQAAPRIVSLAYVESMSSPDIDATERFVHEDELTEKQIGIRDKRYYVIKDMLDEKQCIFDLSFRNEKIRAAAARNNLSVNTVRSYLFDTWRHNGKNGLIPKIENTRLENEVSETEKVMQKALQKYYYTGKKLPLSKAYEYMLHDFYTDETNVLVADAPSFWQFRYCFRKHRNRINEAISREGILAYRRNYRPLQGSVRQNADGMGVYQIDATRCDIHLVSRNIRQLVGRPMLYIMVDTFSNLICGFYLGFEEGYSALSMCIYNGCCDKVKYAVEYGIEISAEEWPASHLPSRIVTDRGKEFTGNALSSFCESQNITIDILPSARPDLKGSVVRLLGAIQEAYKPLLKGRGVIEPNFQDRGAHDYRKDSTLDIDQFTRIIIYCILHINSRVVMKNFIRSAEMVQDGVLPIASEIWCWAAKQGVSTLNKVMPDKVYYTLLPHTTARLMARGLKFQNRFYYNDDLRKEFSVARIQGVTKVPICYDIKDITTVYLIRNGDYIPFKLTEAYMIFHGLGEYEAQQLDQQEKELKATLARRQLQSSVDLIDKIQKEVSQASEEKFETAFKPKQVVQHRNLEKAKIRRELTMKKPEVRKED